MVSTLTLSQKNRSRKSLRTVNLIKPKGSGNLKGRMCASGSLQRKFVPREEANPPKISVEGILATMVIHA